MTFEPTVDIELRDAHHAHIEAQHQEPTDGPHWWHVYQMRGDGISATIVLKQGVPDPPQLTPELVFGLSGLDPDDGLGDLFDGAEVRLLATYNWEPPEDEVEAIARAHEDAGG